MNTENKNKTLSISSLLQEKQSPLTELYKKSRAIHKIDQELKKILDPSLQEHFELANINADIAVLLAGSSAWATRLRYNIPAILNALNNQLNLTAVKTIRIKIKKPAFDHKTSSKKTNILSNKSAQFLNDAANNFNDPEIRACLQKLSKHHL